MATEIERVFLLERMPDLACDVDLARVEQGYLDDDETAPEEGGLGRGRIRRRCGADGTVICTHTIKSGAGMVREEIEREITHAEFLAAWPRTEGRRISKVRYVVPDRTGPVALVWEIDAFDDLPLVLAEVELPATETPVHLPAWLSAVVRREVTEDSRYRNAALAVRGLPQEG